MGSSWLIARPITIIGATAASLVGPLLCRIQVAASVRLADDVAQAPLEARIALVAQPTRAHRSICRSCRQLRFNKRASALTKRTKCLISRDSREQFEYVVVTSAFGGLLYFH